MDAQKQVTQVIPWGKRLLRMTSLRLPDGSRVHVEVPRDVFAPGTQVFWRGNIGQGIGVVLGHAGMVFDPPRVDGTITGIASEGDREREAKVRAREHAVAQVGRVVLRELDLPAKVVRAQAEEGASRFALIVTTNERLEFRAILRLIGQRTRERVDLRVVGDRDAAQVIGGVGPCGLQLCCSTFLSNFVPVNIRMARDQRLPLNPERINGVCGRLLCCLVYEDAQYRAIRGAVPRIGDKRTTGGVVGEVITVDALAGTARLRMADGSETSVLLAESEPISRVDGDSPADPSTSPPAP